LPLNLKDLKRSPVATVFFVKLPEA
jgi:hypothetical protein